MQADARRRQAMIHGDVDALLTLLADDLTWTHSSGKTETKTEFINAIASGSVQYEALEIADDEVRGNGSILVHNGVLTGAASRDGASKTLHARFLSIWRCEHEHYELMAWQSTNTST